MRDNDFKVSFNLVRKKVHQIQQKKEKATMDLSKFFIEKFDIKKHRGYFRFFKEYIDGNIRGITLEVDDEEDAIQKWKERIYPTNTFNEEKETEFILLSFWLYENGFVVDNHPRILEKFNTREAISSGEMYNKTKKVFGVNSSGAVTWKSRREYIDGLIIKREDNSAIVIEQSLNSIMTLVSPRNADFERMELNEKLANIRDVFEHIGKQNGKYTKIPFESLTRGHITTESVLKFKDELQCFRHGLADMVEQRSKYSDEEKRNMVDYGLVILSVSYRYLKNQEGIV